MFTLDLPPTAESVPVARSALDALGDSVSAETMDDARLLVSELVSNSVRHARLAPADTIGVSASLAGGTLRVEVRDQGIGFVLAPRDPSSLPDAGWGLYLVSHVADRWGVAADGITLVWFEIAADRSRA